MHPFRHPCITLWAKDMAPYLLNVLTGRTIIDTVKRRFHTGEDRSQEALAEVPCKSIASGNQAILFSLIWSRRRDLNPRPSDYKSDALPTELRRRLAGEASERMRHSFRV